MVKADGITKRRWEAAILGKPLLGALPFSRVFNCFFFLLYICHLDSPLVELFLSDIFYDRLGTPHLIQSESLVELPAEAV